MDMGLISGKGRGTGEIYGGEEILRTPTSHPEGKKRTQGGRVGNMIIFDFGSRT
jgi:hypothetical protein